MSGWSLQTRISVAQQAASGLDEWLEPSNAYQRRTAGSQWA